MLAHDGYVLIRLRLLTIEEGGPKRGLSNGSRAWWTVGGALDTAPIELVGRRKALEPGATAQIQAYPFQPHLWAGLRAGDEVLMGHPRRRRTIGEGVVEELVRVPTEPVALNVLPFKESPSHRPLFERSRSSRFSLRLWRRN